MSQRDSKFHCHVELCSLQHRLGFPSKCGFDFDHFLDAVFCKKNHKHTHDGRICVCSHGHYHEVRCAEDHGVANSRNAGRVYLGPRSWSLFNDSLDSADKNFLIKFISATPSLLRDLYDHGIDPAEVYSLCLATAPQVDYWRASGAKDLKVGRKLLQKIISWLGTKANTIPPYAVSVMIPGPGESVIAEPGLPLNSVLFREMLATIREVRTDKAAITRHNRERWPPAAEEQIRLISLAPYRIDPSLVLHLEALEQQLEAISEVHRRPRGAPRRQLETSFIRSFTKLARQKTRRPLDGLGARLFAFAFSRQITLEDYTKRRSEMEAPSNRRGALSRAIDFLRQELAAGPRPISELVSRAHGPDVSRNTLFRAALQLGLERSRVKEEVFWSLRKDPKAPTASTKRN